MKIAIEAQRLFRKKKHGMDMVVLELIRHLQQLDTENQYVVFVRPDEDDQVIQETPNFKIVPLNGGPYPVWEQIALPAAVKKHKCDLLHCTSNTAPLLSPVPVVLTLHDIIFMESSLPNILLGKGSGYQKFGNAYRRMIVPRLVKKSRKIITVSAYERRHMLHFFQLEDDNRLLAVYNGIGESFRQVTDAGHLEAIKAKYALPDRFFFFLGNTHPKKNTPGVLKAFSDYVRQTGGDEKLVMIDYDSNELKKLLAGIGDPQLMERIVLTGYISNNDLPAIYSQSQLFLYPSLRESFGIPILEAMACGTPVITSNTSSMPEVAGEAACFVDPFQPATITMAMEKIQTDAGFKEWLVEQGYKQAAKFSWMAMAQQVLHIYKETWREQQALLSYI